MMKAIALFFPALISVGIYVRRRPIEWMLTLNTLVKYGIYVMFTNWCCMSLLTYVVRMSDCRVEYLDSWGFFTKYLLLAVFVAWLIPYVEEIVSKSIQVSFQVKTKVEEENEDAKES